MIDRRLGRCLITGIALICNVLITHGETVDYMPKFSGGIRSRWEMETESGNSRFTVRSARVMMNGSIAAPIDYYLAVDLCDNGKMKFLDGWIKLKATKDLAFQAGQYIMPFGVEPSRSPLEYYFNNRSFLSKYACFIRSVGVKADYAVPGTQLKLEGGVFNASSTSDQDSWSRQLAFSSRATYKLDNMKFVAGFQSTSPDSVRINLVDACVNWSAGRWVVEGEYVNRHYTNQAYKTTHAYSMYANYAMPISAGIFNRLSFQGRFDGMTDNSTGTRVNGELVTNQKARNRVTIGSTISYIKTPMHADIRLNYEKYFYHEGVVAPEGSGDKVSLELVLRF